jgi:hypothetical protein
MCMHLHVCAPRLVLKMQDPQATEARGAGTTCAVPAVLVGEMADLLYHAMVLLNLRVRHYLLRSLASMQGVEESRRLST